MSGGNYDGGIKHMENNAQAFKATLVTDNLNKNLFENDIPAQNLAYECFKHFQTSNPLHGYQFPLTVKAMREFSAMVADLFGQKHAKPSSSGEEALRIGLWALKEINCHEKEPCRFLVLDDVNKVIEKVQNTLNITAYRRESVNLNNLTSEVKGAAIYVTREKLENLPATLEALKDKEIETHVHFSTDAFNALLANDSGSSLQGLKSYPPVSLSMDTDGLFYNGVSATVFTDQKRRRSAIEFYTEWSGGLYPALNTSGSIAGVDYIIAYFLALHKGKPGLIDLAQKNAENSYDPKTDSRQQSSHAELVKESLRVFNAPVSFQGRITSGGTESIRLGIQAFRDKFLRENPGKKPVILMSEYAHIAFFRHIKDLDVTYIKVNNTDDKTINTADLSIKIENHKTQGIAGIVISLPNYPVGTYDDVIKVSSLAQKQQIPLLVDNCLGAWVTQFIEINPLKIDLSKPKFVGITIITADLHKYGFTRKGLSVVVYNTDALERFPDNICHPRSSSQLETGLACLRGLGHEGYKQRAEAIVALAKQLREGLEKIPAIEIVGKPKDHRIPHFVIAFKLKDPLKNHIYALASYLGKLGFYISQVRDYTVHVAVTYAHVQNSQFLPKFLSDIRFIIETLHKYPHFKPATSGGVYGMAANINNTVFAGQKTQKAMLEILVRLYADNLVTAKY